MLKDRIKEERERAGLTQQALGQLLGVSQQAIGKWEQGITEPSYAMLVKLSGIFQCSVGRLLGEDEPERSESFQKVQKELDNTLDSFIHSLPRTRRGEFTSKVIALLDAESESLRKKYALMIDFTPSGIRDLAKLPSFAFKADLCGVLQRVFSQVCEPIIVNLDVFGEIEATPDGYTLGDPQGTADWITKAGYSKDCYMLKVAGDSMYPRFFPGDLVVVQPHGIVGNGDVAVVIVDGEHDGSIKRIKKVPSGMILHSDNPLYEDREFFYSDHQRVKIVGKVIDIIPGRI